jgi:hypothetical protein
LSCCADNLFTSLKVCNESKYTYPSKSVSAKTGTDVMNDAINKNFATMADIDALSGNFVRLFEQRIGQLLSVLRLLSST